MLLDPELNQSSHVCAPSDHDGIVHCIQPSGHCVHCQSRSETEPSTKRYPLPVVRFPTSARSDASNERDPDLTALSSTFPLQPSSSLLQPTAFVSHPSTHPTFTITLHSGKQPAQSLEHPAEQSALLCAFPVCNVCSRRIRYTPSHYPSRSEPLPTRSPSCLTPFPNSRLPQLLLLSAKQPCESHPDAATPTSPRNRAETEK